MGECVLHASLSPGVARADGQDIRPIPSLFSYCLLVVFGLAWSTGDRHAGHLTSHLPQYPITPIALTEKQRWCYLLYSSVMFWWIPMLLPAV